VRELHLVALHEIAVASSGLLDPSALAELVIQQARELLAADEVTLLWWDPASESLRVVADTYEHTEIWSVTAGEGVGGLAYQRGAPVVVEDYPNWEDAMPNALKRGMKSMLGVPLLVLNRSLGSIAVSFNSNRRFKSEDLRILSLLANQVAPALEAAQLHEALEQASKAKSEFLAGMSHELRTPLNAILGFSELLINPPGVGYDRETEVKFLQFVHSAGEHLLLLINDILDISKVEAGQMALHPEPIALAALIHDVIATVSPMAAAKEIALVEEHTEGQVAADPTKLRQVLLNLLSNAIKFTPERGRVEVNVEIDDHEVTIAVADTGRGINADDLDHVFEEFWQAEGADSEAARGTGLGLALTKKLVELHQGRIGVKSVLGEGTVFSVQLPRSPVPEATDEPPDYQVVDRPLVMVVEDDRASAQLLTRYLHNAGYSVAVVTNGTEILENARRLQPRAITLDLMLPNTDGWEALTALKSDLDTAHIPVIMVTVVDAPEIAASMGADDYIIKPVTRAALLKSLSRLVPHPNADQSQPSPPGQR
jgi:signal transduction histidine kinase/ActR/RegA family two-component response regulator